MAKARKDRPLGDWPVRLMVTEKDYDHLRAMSFRDRLPMSQIVREMVESAIAEDRKRWQPRRFRT